MNLKAAPVTLVFIAAILAGLLNLFSKDLLNAGLGPLEICFCRESVTAVAFFLILLAIDRSAFKVRLRDLWMFALFGLFNVASNVCVFQAQETLPLEVAAVLEMTSPYFVLVFAFFLFGDRITKRKVLAVMLAFIGCLFVIGVADDPSGIKIGGVAIGLLSGITLAAFTLGSKFVGERGFSENTAMFYFFLFSAILAAPLTDFGLLGRTIASDAFIPICIVVMGLACTLAPNYLIIYGIRRVDPATVSIIITSSLIVSTICGVLAFGDHFDMTDVIGIILVMIAITVLEPPKALKEKLDRIGKKDKRKGFARPSAHGFGPGWWLGSAGSLGLVVLQDYGDLVDIELVHPEEDIGRLPVLVPVIGLRGLVVVSEVLEGRMVDLVPEREDVVHRGALPAARLRADGLGYAERLGIEWECVAAGVRVQARVDVEPEIVAETVLLVVDAVAVGVHPVTVLADVAGYPIPLVGDGMVVLGHQRQELAHDDHYPAAVAGVVYDDPLHAAVGLDLVQLVDEEEVRVLLPLLGGQRLVVVVRHRGELVE